MAEEQISPEPAPEPIPEPQPVVEPISKPEITTKPTNSRLKIILFAVLGLILASVLFFAGYKFGQKQTKQCPTPTPLPSEASRKEGDLTANWKTYTNTEYGYLIKYPDDMTIETVDLGEGKSTNVTAALLSRIIVEGQDAPFIMIEARANSLNLSLEDWTEKVLKTGESIGLTEITQYPIAGEIGIRGNDGCCGAITDGVYVLKNHLVYSVSSIVQESREALGLMDSFKPTFDQILSTFKFLEEGNQEASGEKVFCEDPRPEVCTMECIANPPYICGSNDKSYCSVCAACTDWVVDWYVVQDEPCK